MLLRWNLMGLSDNKNTNYKLLVNHNLIGVQNCRLSRIDLPIGHFHNALRVHFNESCMGVHKSFQKNSY